MKTITNIICSAFATVALASSSFGALYETPSQFEPRKPDDVMRADSSTVFMTWTGKTVVHVGGFQNGKCFMETFSYRDGHRMNNADISKFLTPYLRAGMSTGPVTNDGKDDFLSLHDRNGEAPAMIHFAMEKKVLSVMTWDCWISVYPKEAAQRAALLKQKAPATPAPADEKNDCLIIATEAFARLKQSSAWARIAGFNFLNDGKNEGGHAVVFYQPTATSNVFIYDKTLGSLDLQTQSHELTVIIEHLNAMLKKADLFQAGDPKWLGEAGGLVSDAVDQRAASTTTTPAPVSTPVMTGAVGHSVSANVHAIADDINTVLIVAVVIGFGVMLRYGGIRLWPIAILSEPVYLIIEAIRANRRRKT